MKLRTLRLCLLAIALLSSRLPALAWGFTGHHIVAEVAKNFLTKPVLDSVQKYLGDMSFDDAATWMDDVRKDSQYDYMKPWHYVNVEKDKTYVKTSEDNIINELDRVIAELNYRSKLSKNDIRTDLKVLFHLTGDLHMPLHAGYFSDKGGNTVEVEILGRKSNLHRAWDTDILEAKKISTEDCIKLANAIPASEREKLSNQPVEDWMAESRAMLAQVYDFKGNTLDADYINKNAPAVARRLTLAGLRLAGVLNKAFKSN
jgi:hypothetical protein